jgi:hypothetical protein
MASNTRRLSAQVLAAIGAVTTMAGPAHAFDSINWTWNLNLSTDITVTGTIDIGSIGGSIVEQEQVMVGGTVATATATGIAPLDGLLPPLGTDAPTVQASATAVNNNLSITTDQALLLDSSQTTLGVGSVALAADLLDLATLDLSLVVPSVVTATATAIGTDTYTDATAVAAANSLNVESTGAVLSNGVQFAVAAVGATATSTGTQLLQPDLSTNGPWVKASATAVGNNVNITVAAPAP